MRLGVTPEAVRAEFKKLAQAQAAPGPEETEESFEDAAPAQRPSAHEYWLLKLLLANDDLAPWAVDHLNPQWIQHALARQIVEQRLAAHEHGTWSSLSAFIADLADPATRNLITEAVTEPRPVPSPAQQLTDVVKTLRNQALDREMARLMQQLNQPGNPDEARVDIMRRQAALRAEKRTPLTAMPPAGEGGEATLEGGQS